MDILVNGLIVLLDRDFCETKNKIFITSKVGSYTLWFN